MISSRARADDRRRWSTGLVTAGAIASLLLFGIGVSSFSETVGAAKKKQKRSSVNLRTLPLGDGKVIGSGAKRGYLLSCQTNFVGGGPNVNGPWIHGTTYDLTAKYVVDGAVSWPGSFQATIARGGVTLVGNGLPNHPTGVFPVQANDDSFQIDRNPNRIAPYTLSKTLNGSPRKGAPQCVGGGVGVAKSGVPIFNALDAAGRDAVAHEVQDACSGHPQQAGVYHYHGLPACVSTGSKKKRSGLVGWALDGFPIFGPRGEGGEYLSNKKLDVCHGIKSEVNYDGKLRTIYHYIANYEFPYTVGCFRGTPANGNFGPQQQGPPG
jgi:hypothetical protein